MGKQAGHLTVFQRTPAFTAPAHDRPVPPEEYHAFVNQYP
jgi:cation diffusion facilitator CzcD-associated flavoprotein CzcO